MELMQRITSLIGINNTIKQYVNTYENKELLTHLLGNEFEKIESFLKEGEVESARSQIDIILCKKETLPEELECKLVFLKGSIEIELNNLPGVKAIIELLQKKEEGVKYSLELKYINAVKCNNEELMDECINAFISNGECEITVLKKQLEFYLLNSHPDKILDKLKYIEERKINDKSIFHYVAVAYLNTGDTVKAKEFCDKAIECGGADLTYYVKIIAEITPIIQRRGIAITISQEEKDFLLVREKRLTELLDRLPNEIEGEVLGVILNIYLLVDLDKAYDFYKNNKEKLSNSIDSKIIIANIYELKNEYEEAKKIYLQILEEKWIEELLVHVMGCMDATEDYKSYIHIFEKYRNRIIDKDFILTEFYLKSIQKINRIGKASEELENIRGKYSNSIRFKLYLASIDENEQEKIELLKEAEEMLNDSNQYDREEFKRIYWEIGEYDEAIRVARPLFKYKEFLVSIVRLVISNKRKEFYLELIKEIDKHKDIRLLKYKQYMLYEINEIIEAKQVAEMIYKLENNKDNLVELIYFKILAKDSLELENLLLKIIPSNNPADYMMVSYGYTLLGDIAKAKSYSYEALFKSEGIFEKNLFANFVSMNFRLAIEGKEEIKEFESVKEDSVVVLRSATNNINICLNSEEKYQINEKIFGCLHITKNSSLWIDLIGQKVGDKIVYNDEEFEIESITDKIIIVHHYCLNKLNNSGYDWGMRQVSIDEAPEFMKEISISDKEAFEKKLNMYNFQYNDMGLPFSKILYGDDMKKSIELLNIILLNQQNVFYIGASTKGLKQENYVLSYQTLLLLEHYDLLKILLYNPNNYYVSGKLKQKIIDTIVEIKNRIKELYLHYDFEIGVCKEERDHTIILNKLKSILAVLDKINTKESNYKIRDTLLNMSRKFIFEFDIETIYLAKEVNGILVIDDLFIRKLINSNVDTKELNHANISNLLGILYRNNPKKYYDTIKQMISDKVKYVLDKDDFKTLIINYKANGYDIEWFQQLIDNMISDGDIYYRNIILIACQELNDFKIYKNTLTELLIVVEKLKLKI